MKLRRLLMLSAALPLFSACNAGDDLPTPPIILPFEVQKAGTKIEAIFRIDEPARYRFKLEFLFNKNDPEDRLRVKKLVGSSGINKYTGRPVDTGIPIPIRIRVFEINDVEERAILDKEVTELALYGSTAERFDKKIVDSDLSPGQYRVSIDSLEDIPELQKTRVEFAIVRAYIGK